jgi:hypothetical protein
MSDTRDVWASLTRPGSGVSARRHPASPNVWLALDGNDRRHLLVQVPTSEPGLTLMVTRGLRAETTEMSVEGGPTGLWADISCMDPALNTTFLTVADDLAKETAKADDPLMAVQRTLRAWRWFWGVDPDELSEQAAIGLFGELWFLDRWAPFPGAVPAWHGPEANRHDFAGVDVSVEVKTFRSQAVGPPQHEIANLDQLDDPEAGQLYLFSVQAIPDPAAGNTLPTLVARLRTRLAEHTALLTDFDERLAKAGWSPAHADRHGTRYRIASERLYLVGNEFPRLTRHTFDPHGLPAGVDDVRYTLDLAACNEWLVASDAAAGAELLVGLSNS